MLVLLFHIVQILTNFLYVFTVVYLNALFHNIVGTVINMFADFVGNIMNFLCNIIHKFNTFCKIINGYNGYNNVSHKHCRKKYNCNKSQHMRYKSYKSEYNRVNTFHKRDTHKTPIYRKFKAYVTAYVKRHIRIIPPTCVEYFVECKTCNQFQY